MSQEVKTVDCGKCRKLFEMPTSNIKGIAYITLLELNDKYKCPHCNKKHKTYFDPTIDSKKALEEHKAKNLEEERRKAAQPISCPQCSSTQYYVGEKGFSAGKAIVGNAVAGGIGMLAGFHGSKNLVFTCLKCGNKWKAPK